MKQSVKQWLIDAAMVFSFFWLFGMIIYGIYVFFTKATPLMEQQFGYVLTVITVICLITFVYFAQCPESYWNWYERGRRE